MRGAGGSEGGAGRFIIGLIMMVMGGYLFLDAIHVTNRFGFGASIYNFGGGFRLTPGIVLIPFLFGIGMIFYDAKNDIGWILVIITLVLLGVGVISNIDFRLRSMSAFELLMILGLGLGGVGLFLSSLRKL
ncbi:MAG: hypothetical protein GY862_05425 [Gammaproteobacteria bacterium]|nr:hypothetical protein [Gammaproteobacteria bacterium]